MGSIKYFTIWNNRHSTYAIIKAKKINNLAFYQYFISYTQAQRIKKHLCAFGGTNCNCSGPLGQNNSDYRTFVGNIGHKNGFLLD